MSVSQKLAFLCLAASALAPSAEAQGPPPVPEPTAEHKLLAADAGTWDATIKTFLGGPEPLVSKGVEVNEVMTGGLWVLSRFEGSFGPAKFEGRGQYSYDAAKKKYVGTWIDSMAPTVSVLEGTYDAKAKTMSYVGDGYDPAQQVKYTQRMVTTMKDDGTRVFTLYMKYEGAPAEAKFMEITYTKRK